MNLRSTRSKAGNPCRPDRRESSHELRITHLHDLDFDPDFGGGGYRAAKPLEPDLEAVMANMDWAEHVVLLSPMWWGGLPAKLKGLFDRALLPGSAFDTRAKTLAGIAPAASDRTHRAADHDLGYAALVLSARPQGRTGAPDSNADPWIRRHFAFARHPFFGSHQFIARDESEVVPKPCETTRDVTGMLYSRSSKADCNACKLNTCRRPDPSPQGAAVDLRTILRSGLAIPQTSNDAIPPEGISSAGDRYHPLLSM
ncbi:NAD(P)H-dependent oxidoreductase [Rhodovulum sulfidophilum]|uniref:NAD(P)H-dependent oxidoreductase n=1 Tax=Rhodovulum sulfidophilum TaxID=35806 RepID=UPI001F3E0741